MLTEQKLRKIFPQAHQVKRIFNEILELRDLKEKGVFDMKVSTIQNQRFNFTITMLPKSFENTTFSSDEKPVFKLALNKNYPNEGPMVFFIHDNMVILSLRPCRNYLHQIIAPEKWSEKYTLVQLVKRVPMFLERHSKLPANEIPIAPPLFCEYFELDTIFSWQFCQVYPVRLCKGSALKDGIILLIKLFSQVLILEKVNNEQLFLTCDFFEGKQIKSIQKNKNNPYQILVELKLNYHSLKGQYCFEFYLAGSEDLIMNLIDISKQQKSQTQFLEESSEQSEEQSIQKLEINEGMSINELHDNIVLYQSMVQSKITSQNIRQLILLLQKAIEYYSAREDQRFEIYLTKLRKILSNKLVQVILQSQSDMVMKERKEAKHKSILDLF